EALQRVGVDHGRRRVVGIADKHQPRPISDCGGHRIQVERVVSQWHLNRYGAGEPYLKRIDLEAAPAVHHLVADGAGDLDQLLAQTHRTASRGDLLGREADVHGQAIAQFDVAVVWVSVDVVGGFFDGGTHARQRTVHG